ncbi:MAG TPA: M13 family metallopeptidase [Kofleriaceae bacterium]|jgi:endothelin-converting enzyme/putative endopeptidase|nr:M13 family metallopeptidase [Kofleriaceae bacterium]
MRSFLLAATALPFALAVVAIAQPSKPAPAAIPAHVPGLETRFIDTGADPCTDFFKYACGNFAKYYPIPNDLPAYSSGAIVFDHNEAVLHAMLEKVAAPNASRSASEQKIGDFYAACMDTATIDRKGLQPFHDELAKIDAVKTKADLAPLIGHDQVANVAAFVAVGEQQDFKTATQQIAVIDQGGLGLPERDYYVRTGADADKTRKQYVAHVGNVLKLLGEPAAQASKDATAIFALETALAKASMDVTSRRDPHNVYHLMSVDDAAKLMPSLPLKQLLEGAGIGSVTQLNVANPDFMKGASAVIDATDVATIKAYLRWQLVAATNPIALPKTLDDEHFAFYGKALRGQPEQRARWKRCVQATDGALGEALGQVYVAQEFPPSSKAATLQMVHDIEGAMSADIDTLDWMSPMTKQRAKQKLKLVAEKIGYPDHFRDYTKITVARDDAFGDSLRAVMFENDRQFAKIGKPLDRGEWLMSPPTVDAYYNPSMNDINFPAGILQSPLYDPQASDAVNYGHVGAIVGHELTHGFDDEGRQFDGNGNLADWWAGTDGAKFDAKAKCTVDEYSSFVAVGDVHINGKLTLGENTADNGGLRLAYQAFLTDAQRKHIDLAAKGANGYTPVQELFIGFGQNWCGQTRPEQQRLQVQTDPHSPREFRANGVARNMPELAKAFGCKVGQPMMPKTVCRTW